MKRVGINFFVAILFSCYFSHSTVFAVGTYNGGDGSGGNPFQIATPQQLYELTQHAEDWGEETYFVLTNNLDMTAYAGMLTDTIGNYDVPFSGNFNGEGYLISNFTWASDAVNYIGLFGYIAHEGEVYDIRMEYLSINDESAVNVGGIAGGNEGYIHDCKVSGTIIGDVSVGGIVGMNYYEGTVTDCLATGEVACQDYAVGGIVGSNAGIIARCAGQAEVTGGDWAGGFIGYSTAWSIIFDCYAVGTVSGLESVGGFAGINFATYVVDYSDGEIYNCYAAGLVSGNVNVGAFFGDHYYGDDDIDACFWDSDVNSMLNGVGSPTTPDPVGLTGLGTAGMQQRSTYESEGWDFTTPVWIITDELEYPMLMKFVSTEFSDLLMLAAYWLDDGCGYCGGVDFDESGVVDIADFARLSRTYLDP